MIRFTRPLWATACACLALWALTTQAATAADLAPQHPGTTGHCLRCGRRFRRRPRLGNRGSAWHDGVASRSGRGGGLVGALPPRIRPHALLPEQEFHVDRRRPRNRRGTVECRRSGHLILPRCGAGRTGLAPRGHAHPRSPVHVNGVITARICARFHSTPPRLSRKHSCNFPWPTSRAPTSTTTRPQRTCVRRLSRKSPGRNCWTICARGC